MVRPMEYDTVEEDEEEQPVERFHDEDDDEEYMHKNVPISFTPPTSHRRQQPSSWRLYLAVIAIFVVAVVVVTHHTGGNNDAQPLPQESTPSDDTSNVADAPNTAGEDETVIVDSSSGGSDTSTTQESSGAGSHASDEKPFKCIGDNHLKHEKKLKTGHVLCSSNKKYIFGMHADGSLIKWDVKKNEGKHDTFYQGEPDDYFMLHENGDIAVYDSFGELAWKKEPRHAMSVDECLPDYECPFLALHDDGVLVVKWKEDGEMMEKKIKKVYELSD